MSMAELMQPKQQSPITAADLGCQVQSTQDEKFNKVKCDSVKEDPEKNDAIPSNIDTNGSTLSNTQNVILQASENVKTTVCGKAEVSSNVSTAIIPSITSAPLTQTTVTSVLTTTICSKPIPLPTTISKAMQPPRPSSSSSQASNSSTTSCGSGKPKSKNRSISNKAANKSLADSCLSSNVVPSLPSVLCFTLTPRNDKGEFQALPMNIPGLASVILQVTQLPGAKMGEYYTVNVSTQSIINAIKSSPISGANPVILSINSSSLIPKNNTVVSVSQPVVTTSSGNTVENKKMRAIAPKPSNASLANSSQSNVTCSRNKNIKKGSSSISNVHAHALPQHSQNTSSGGLMVGLSSKSTARNRKRGQLPQAHSLDLATSLSSSNTIMTCVSTTMLPPNALVQAQGFSQPHAFIPGTYPVAGHQYVFPSPGTTSNASAGPLMFTGASSSARTPFIMNGNTIIPANATHSQSTTPVPAPTLLPQSSGNPFNASQPLQQTSVSSVPPLFSAALDPRSGIITYYANPVVSQAPVGDGSTSLAMPFPAASTGNPILFNQAPQPPPFFIPSSGTSSVVPSSNLFPQSIVPGSLVPQASGAPLLKTSVSTIQPSSTPVTYMNTASLATPVVCKSQTEPIVTSSVDGFDYGKDDILTLAWKLTQLDDTCKDTPVCQTVELCDEAVSATESAVKAAEAILDEEVEDVNESDNIHQKDNLESEVKSSHDSASQNILCVSVTDSNTDLVSKTDSSCPNDLGGDLESILAEVRGDIDDSKIVRSNVNLVNTTEHLPTPSTTTSDVMSSIGQEIEATISEEKPMNFDEQVNAQHLESVLGKAHGDSDEDTQNQLITDSFLNSLATDEHPTLDNLTAALDQEEMKENDSLVPPNAQSCISSTVQASNNWLDVDSLESSLPRDRDKSDNAGSSELQTDICYGKGDAVSFLDDFPRNYTSAEQFNEALLLLGPPNEDKLEVKLDCSGSEEKKDDSKSQNIIDCNQTDQESLKGSHLEVNVINEEELNVIDNSKPKGNCSNEDDLDINLDHVVPDENLCFEHGGEGELFDFLFFAGDGVDEGGDLLLDGPHDPSSDIPPEEVTQSKLSPVTQDTVQSPVSVKSVKESHVSPASVKEENSDNEDSGSELDFLPQEEKIESTSDKNSDMVDIASNKDNIDQNLHDDKLSVSSSTKGSDGDATLAMDEPILPSISTPASFHSNKNSPSVERVTRSMRHGRQVTAKIASSPPGNLEFEAISDQSADRDSLMSTRLRKRSSVAIDTSIENSVNNVTNNALLDVITSPMLQDDDGMEEVSPIKSKFKGLDSLDKMLKTCQRRSKRNLQKQESSSNLSLDNTQSTTNTSTSSILSSNKSSNPEDLKSDSDFVKDPKPKNEKHVKPVEPVKRIRGRPPLNHVNNNKVQTRRMRESKTAQIQTKRRNLRKRRVQLPVKHFRSRRSSASSTAATVLTSPELVNQLSDKSIDDLEPPVISSINPQIHLLTNSLIACGNDRPKSFGFIDISSNIKIPPPPAQSPTELLTSAASFTYLSKDQPISDTKIQFYSGQRSPSDYSSISADEFFQDPKQPHTEDLHSPASLDSSVSSSHDEFFKTTVSVDIPVNSVCPIGESYAPISNCCSSVTKGEAFAKFAKDDNLPSFSNIVNCSENVKSFASSTPTVNNQAHHSPALCENELLLTKSSKDTTDSFSLTTPKKVKFDSFSPLNGNCSISVNNMTAFTDQNAFDGLDFASLAAKNVSFGSKSNELGNSFLSPTKNSIGFGSFIAEEKLASFADLANMSKDSNGPSLLLEEEHCAFEQGGIFADALKQISHGSKFVPMSFEDIAKSVPTYLYKVNLWSPKLGSDAYPEAKPIYDNVEYTPVSSVEEVLNDNFEEVKETENSPLDIVDTPVVHEEKEEPENEKLPTFNPYVPPLTTSNRKKRTIRRKRRGASFSIKSKKSRHKDVEVNDTVLDRTTVNSANESQNVCEEVPKSSDSIKGEHQESSSVDIDHESADLIVPETIPFENNEISEAKVQLPEESDLPSSIKSNSVNDEDYEPSLGDNNGGELIDIIDLTDATDAAMNDHDHDSVANEESAESKEDESSTEHVDNSEPSVSQPTEEVPRAPLKITLKLPSIEDKKSKRLAREEKRKLKSARKLARKLRNLKQDKEVKEPEPVNDVPESNTLIEKSKVDVIEPKIECESKSKPTSQPPVWTSRQRPATSRGGRGRGRGKKCMPFSPVGIAKYTTKTDCSKRFFSTSKQDRRSSTALSVRPWKIGQSTSGSPKKRGGITQQSTSNISQPNHISTLKPQPLSLPPKAASPDDQATLKNEEASKKPIKLIIRLGNNNSNSKESNNSCNQGRIDQSTPSAVSSTISEDEDDLPEEDIDPTNTIMLDDSIFDIAPPPETFIDTRQAQVKRVLNKNVFPHRQSSDAHSYGLSYLHNDENQSPPKKRRFTSESNNDNETESFTSQLNNQSKETCPVPDFNLISMKDAKSHSSLVDFNMPITDSSINSVDQFKQNSRESLMDISQPNQINDPIYPTPQHNTGNAIQTSSGAQCPTSSESNYFSDASQVRSSTSNINVSSVAEAKSEASNNPLKDPVVPNINLSYDLNDNKILNKSDGDRHRISCDTSIQMQPLGPVRTTTSGANDVGRNTINTESRNLTSKNDVARSNMDLGTSDRSNIHRYCDSSYNVRSNTDSNRRSGTRNERVNISSESATRTEGANSSNDAQERLAQAYYDRLTSAWSQRFSSGLLNESNYYGEQSRGATSSTTANNSNSQNLAQNISFSNENRSSESSNLNQNQSSSHSMNSSDASNRVQQQVSGSYEGSSERREHDYTGNFAADAMIYSYLAQSMYGQQANANAFQQYNQNRSMNLGSSNASNHNNGSVSSQSHSYNDSSSRSNSRTNCTNNESSTSHNPFLSGGSNLTSDSVSRGAHDYALDLVNRFSQSSAQSDYTWDFMNRFSASE